MSRTREYLFLALLLHLFQMIIADAPICPVSAKEIPPTVQIKQHILCDYDATIRPVLDENSAVEVKMFFVINSFDFSEHSNTIDVKAWIQLKWSDEHIYWNLEDFNNYERIFVSSSEIWKPDLSIYNRGPYADTEVIQDKSECLVYYHKKVVCVTPSEMQGMCWPDLRFWPFDAQNCSIRMGSWFHTGEEVNISEIKYIQDPSQFRDNPEWNVEHFKITKDKGAYKKFPNVTYPSIRLQFLIRRHHNAMIVFIIIPYLALISMTILMAWLNPMHSERIYIATFNIPCHIMYLLNATWMLPETADTIPYLIIFLRNSQFLAFLTLIETIVVRTLFSKTSTAPRWLLLLFAYVARNKFAQLLLLSDINPEIADDSANLVEFNQPAKEWHLLGAIIDRLYFWFLIIFCFIMFVLCIPK